MAIFRLGRLERAADSVDLSDLTTAVRTGSAAWVGDGVLEVPFNRALTAAEAAAITRRLSTADASEEQLAGLLDSALANNADYLALTAPTAAQSQAQVAALTRQVSALLRRAQAALSED